MASSSNLWDLNIRTLWPESAPLEPCPNAGRGGDDCTCHIDVTACPPRQWRMVQQQHEQWQAHLKSTLRILPFFNRAVQEKLRQQQQREGQSIGRPSRLSPSLPAVVDNNATTGSASQRRKDSTENGEKPVRAEDPVVVVAGPSSRPHHGHRLANLGGRAHVTADRERDHSRALEAKDAGLQHLSERLRSSRENEAIPEGMVGKRDAEIALLGERMKFFERVVKYYHSRENERLGHAHRHEQMDKKENGAEEEEEAHHPAAPGSRTPTASATTTSVPQELAVRTPPANNHNLNATAAPFVPRDNNHTTSSSSSSRNTNRTNLIPTAAPFYPSATTTTTTTTAAAAVTTVPSHPLAHQHQPAALTRTPWSILQKQLQQNYHLTGRRHALLGEPAPSPDAGGSTMTTTTTTTKTMTSSEIQQMIEAVIHHNRFKTAVSFA